MNQSFYQFKMRSLEDEEVNFSKYVGKVVVLVNVASKCGLTPQYVSLQETYEKYQEQGLVILGFPANNFGAQEPGSNQEIATFCQVNYGVTFPMFSKIEVKGENQHPLYQFLTQKSQNEFQDSEVQWNFQKYIIDRGGKLVQIVPPTTSLSNPEVVALLESLLQN